MTQGVGVGGFEGTASFGKEEISRARLIAHDAGRGAETEKEAVFSGRVRQNSLLGVRRHTTSSTAQHSTAQCNLLGRNVKSNQKSLRAMLGGRRTQRSPQSQPRTPRTHSSATTTTTTKNPTHTLYLFLQRLQSQSARFHLGLCSGCAGRLVSGAAPRPQMPHVRNESTFYWLGQRRVRDTIWTYIVRGGQ